MTKVKEMIANLSKLPEDDEVYVSESGLTRVPAFGILTRTDQDEHIHTIVGIKIDIKAKN